jgi:hypothetical protein
MKTVNLNKKTETYFRPEDNSYLHIYYVPMRGDFRLTMPGRDTTFHDSVKDAMRVRDAHLHSKPTIERAALTPDRMGYMNIERRKAQ